MLSALSVFAEGSKELNAYGGYRVFLFSSNNGSNSFPFPTFGTMKVYVNAGEIIYVGSSAQGDSLGTINLRAPDGKTYTSGSSTSIGLIANHNQEIAGPLPNAGGYTPYTVTVQSGQTGVWEIDFVSQSAGIDYGNPVPVPSNADWTQPQGQYVTAFDVSVRDAGNSRFIGGRVFTNVFSGILGTFNVGFNGIFYVLTKDGYQYSLNNNGQAGNGFLFFANNKGFRDANSNPLYQSVAEINNPDVQDPTAPDSPTDITYKIFFNPPSADLPASAVTPGGATTWLLTAPAAPAITNLTFTGIEGTVGKAGTNPLGANFTFMSPASGTYQVAIDVNQNGVFNDPVDRVLTGNVQVGPNTIFWNGLDGLGNPVPADTGASYNARITLIAKAGEVHFPFFDVERNVNGIILTRTNGDYAPDDTIYWNDSQLPLIGTPSNPLVNLGGISSLVNGHKWGTPTSDPNNQDDFGNNVGIDTWAYTSSAPIKSMISFVLQQADLAVDTLISVANCAGQPVTFTVAVKNNGPSAVTGAKFKFNFPPDITGVNVNSAATNGASSVSGGAISATAYNADLFMANGAVRTFTITGVIAINASGTIDVSASMLRPADVTDPDATDPADTGPPTDPVTECNALPSGPGCNNIKTATTSFNTAPNAGPDQTVLRNETVYLTATGEGNWSEASGDPSVAAIGNPSGSSTTVTGLNTTGSYHFIYTNAQGCADTVAVMVESADMVIPNIITPNGDGKNDVFKIKGLEGYPGSQLLIFNRWGNEVYKSDNYLNNWDGSGLAEGTYYYILNRKEQSGNITTFKGWVFLKRSK
ncbi:MAG TPA: gliding motility-associated C-terminal domain-containing protein [Mucilaginibacter sp.]|nr:gliding motility-associated C-terminal domain-containing protein [Mucilaginibacter sp.]